MMVGKYSSRMPDIKISHEPRSPFIIVAVGFMNIALRVGLIIPVYFKFFTQRMIITLSFCWDF